MADDSWSVPTPVQELAATVEEPPSQYVLREQDRPSSLQAAADMPDPIPVVDLSRLADDPAEADKLQAALQTWGLVLVTNHGIETPLMHGVMDAAREFFHQPLEVKQKYSNLIDGKQFQAEGYGNDGVLTQDQVLDWIDRLHLTVEPNDERKHAFWPEHPESFRDVLHEYTSKTKKIRDTIFQAMARILELEEDYFIRQMSEKAHAFAIARFNYYPPCPRPDLVNGIRPHSDGGVLTILLVDKEVRGLQVQRDGIWYNVPSEPYTLVVNLGDSMEGSAGGGDGARGERQQQWHARDVRAGGCGGAAQGELRERWGDNEQWDLQEPCSQGCDKCGEGEDLFGRVLQRGW